MQTRNESLQKTLSSWVEMITNIISLYSTPSIERNNAIISFVRTFVSLDIEGNLVFH